MGDFSNGGSLSGYERWVVLKYVLFSHLFGEDVQFDQHIFQMGWFNHQLVICERVKDLGTLGSAPPENLTN